MWIKDAAGNTESRVFGVMVNDAVVADTSKPYFSGMNLGSTVTSPNKIYFSGAAIDDKSLSQITMKVSGPKGNDLIAFSNTISGTNHSLSNYYFDSNNSAYAGIPGNYTVAMWIKDAAGNTESRVFGVTINTPTPIYGYRLLDSYVTTGGGTWGSILNLNASINSSGNVAFTVNKKTGAFTTASTAYLKVGSYESYGVNHAQGSIPSGGSSKQFNINIAQLDWPQSIKSYYIRVQNNDGFAWVGPIRVERYVK